MPFGRLCIAHHSYESDSLAATRTRRLQKRGSLQRGLSDLPPFRNSSEESRVRKISEIILNCFPKQNTRRVTRIPLTPYRPFRAGQWSQEERTFSIKDKEPVEITNSEMSTTATTVRKQVSFERAFCLPSIQIEAAVLSRFSGRASCECSQCRLNGPVSNGNEERSMPPPTRFARPTYVGLPPKGPSYSVEPAQAANSGPIGTSAVQVDRLVVPTISG